MSDQRGFFSALIGDGRPPLLFTGLCLALSGAFALFLAATGHFLPHDIEFLGMHPQELCAINECRIVHFMIHDRVSFGGALIGIGAFYMWLAEFPLRRGEAWAWWLFLISGIVGFGSFLAYLGYGYLDSWHGSATLVLLPTFTLGMIRSRQLLPGPSSLRTLLTPCAPLWDRSIASTGRLILLGTSLGLIGAGMTIMIVGMTCVFVPQDLAYMGMTADELHAINPRLIPLIAHDRAGFGGAVCTGGVLVFFSLWCGQPSRSLWQVLTLATITGFGTAVGIHPAIGYNDTLHLAPAVIGAIAAVTGLALTYPSMMHATRSSTLPQPARSVAPLAVLLLASLMLTPAAADAPVTGESTIRAKAGPSEIVITTTSRVAGAIHSLTWNGMEFIDSVDHGRQLQSASNFDNNTKYTDETFNPTEAGSRADHTGDQSTSRLLKITAKDNVLETKSQMAFWLRPGEKSLGNLAKNTTVLSNHLLAKRVRIGYKDLPHVIEYEVTFTIPADEKHTYAQFESLTGYMPPAFGKFYKYDTALHELKPLSEGPGEQNLPVVLATDNGSHAMGIFSPQQPSAGYETAGYGRWSFKPERVNKWNTVFRYRDKNGVKPGDYSFRHFVIVGSIDDVKHSMKALINEFKKP